MADEVLVERANAKINLGLKVLGPRPDGYHDICSIAQSLDLADVLHLRPSAATRLTCTEPALSTGADNLVLRAAELFNARLGTAPQRFDIHLEKCIPVGAGLGGGSADAAAVLRALNRFHGRPFARAELQSLGSCLGSDIPFLIEGGTALMRGRGERLEPLVWRGDVHYVLACPAIEISTAWAYRHVAPHLTPESPYLNFVDSFSDLLGILVV